MYDPVKNFAKCIVSGGYSSSATVITLQTGEGFKLPDPAIEGAFNLVWWNYTDYKDPSDDPNRGIVRVTARTNDVLTVIRGQEGIAATTKNNSGKQYYMMIAYTKKTYDDNSSIVQGIYAPAAGSTCTLDLGAGKRHSVQMPAGNITLALTNVKVGDIFMIEITQDSVGGRTATWFSNIKWEGGVAPVLTLSANKRDTFGFVCTASGNYDGYIMGQNI
jgi:hypothetical protein